MALAFLSYIMQPQIFFLALAILCFLGISAVVASGRWQKRINAANHDIIIKNRMRITELEALLSDHERGYARRIKELQYQVDELKKELSLKNQMYEGLKGQMEEMERDQEKDSMQ